MGTLYENIITLCNECHIKAGKMCNDTGISRGLITDLKSGRKKSITVDTAKKIADYFGVSVDCVLNIDYGISEEQKSPTSEDVGLESEFMKLFKLLSPEDQAREIAYLRERAGVQDK